MTDFYCPTCGTELMEHEAKYCLNAWVALEIYGLVPCDQWKEEPHELDFGQLTLDGRTYDLTFTKSCNHAHCYSTNITGYQGRIYGGAPSFSFLVVEAYRVMEWVWKQEPYAAIYKDRIAIHDKRTMGGLATVPDYITGPTFPLRVCRTAMWLALQTQNPT